MDGDKLVRVMSFLEGLTQDDWREFHSDSEVQNIAKSALELLKEKEPVYVTWQQGKMFCGACGAKLLSRTMMRFCHRCGREIRLKVNDN